MNKNKKKAQNTHKLGIGIGKWFKNNWIGFLVGTIFGGLFVGAILSVAGPHLETIWPVKKPIVVSSPRSDYSIPQAYPPINGVSSFEMSIDNYRIGYEINSSATIYNNEPNMTTFIIKAIVPPLSDLRDGYAVAPVDIVNWVNFNTGGTILIEPNSKVTVDIIFKVPSSYRKSLPPKW